MGAPQIIHDDTLEELDIGQPGGVLHTSGDAECSYRTVPGAIQTEESRFTFAGTAEVFSAYYGQRTRSIVWEGNLRCSEDGLAAIREAQDDFLTRAGLFTFVDDDGTEYAGCRFAAGGEAFALGAKQRIQDRGDLVWHLSYRIELEQLEP